MLHFLLAVPLALTLLLALSLPAAAVTVTMNPGGNASVINLVAVGEPVLSVPISGLPVNTTLERTASGPGAASMRGTLAFSDQAFDLTLEELSAPGPSVGAVWVSTLFFSVDAAVGYRISGDMVATNPAGVRVGQFVFLGTPDEPGALLSTSNDSTSTANESFVVGVLTGDSGSALTGSLQGMLEQDVEYQLIFNWILTDSGEVNSASAIGSFRMEFVPEPGTGVLLVLALVVAASAPPRARDKGRLN